MFLKYVCNYRQDTSHICKIMHPACNKYHAPSSHKMNCIKISGVIFLLYETNSKINQCSHLRLHNYEQQIHWQSHYYSMYGLEVQPTCELSQLIIHNSHCSMTAYSVTVIHSLHAQLLLKYATRDSGEGLSMSFYGLSCTELIWVNRYNIVLTKEIIS